MVHITHLNNSSCFSFEMFKYKTLLNYCKTCKNSNIFKDLTIHIKTIYKKTNTKTYFWDIIS